LFENAGAACATDRDRTNALAMIETDIGPELARAFARKLVGVQIFAKMPALKQERID
jgi:hypothetical protein